MAEVVQGGESAQNCNHARTFAKASIESGIIGWTSDYFESPYGSTADHFGPESLNSQHHFEQAFSKQEF
jgi:hypothetical protein